ncbi:hypothetical protein AB5J52_48695 (plasmid) [Streptomyces sp. R39]|uniref:Lipoprotein n=1 Tax=Streptomyces sp. R39 TaxID=3238631 RepID=A0AB39R2D5_9ACTN
MPRPSVALRLGAPLAVLPLVLTACNGKDGDTGAAQQATTRAKPSPSTSTSAPLTAGDSIAGTVKEDNGLVTYSVAAQQLTFGTQAQAKAAVQNPADAKGKVIATVRVRYTHQAGPTVTTSTNADDATTVWAEGQRGTILLNSPTNGASCDDPYDIASWKTGQSHTFCEYYLLPATAKKAEVHWSEDGGRPYVWTFAGPGA